MKQLFALLSVVWLVVSCSETENRFVLIPSSKTGINFNNKIVENDSFNILNNEYIYNGGGVGVADLNNDGLQDLIFTGNKVSSKIYLNKGDFKFKDITNNFKGLDNSQWIGGVSVTDLNNDGYADLYFASSMSNDTILRRNQYWVNLGLNDNGEPIFENQAAQYGIDDPGYSIHSGFFDYDLDGDLDLYVLNNIVGATVPTNYREKMKQGESPNNDQFYRNNGNGTFTNITVEAGIIYEGFGLGLAFGDLNKDGYPDIYVSNDYISNDLIYINQKNGTFKNMSEDIVAYQSKFSMGNDISDFNNDGNLDVVTLDMLPENYFRKKQTINGNSYYIYINDEKFDYQKQYVRNMLQVNNGMVDGKLAPMSEVGQLAGIHQTEWSWSPLFADYDNDGDRDLLITNGFPRDLTDKDFTNYKAKMHGYLAGDMDIISQIPVVKVPNYAYENQGGVEFENVTQKWGLNTPSFSNGAVFVDLDNDGNLDYVVNNINEEAFIYKNNLNSGDNINNFISVKLNGSTQNKLAIGSKVELWYNGKRLYQELYLTRGYISSVQPFIHFGVGKAQIIDSIKVIWPDLKSISILKEVSVNQTLTVHEEDAQPFVFVPFNGKSNYLFKENDTIINFTHSQEDVADFFVAPYIKDRKFSQIGPCMAQGDVNNDGLVDILIGASNTEPTMVFTQSKSGGFNRFEFDGLSANKGSQESDLLIFDFDKDGDNDVIAIAGGGVYPSDTIFKHYIYINNENKFTKRVLPLPSFQASVVKQADFNGDGFMDLFVGATAHSTKYPKADNSYILINDNGVFKLDNSYSFDLGMVRDAIWSDYDGDNDLDIIIAREWNSVCILQNNDGQSFDLLKDPTLESEHGFWSAIEEVDFDNDGDMDYLLGNIGENYRFDVSTEYPLHLYAVDIDDNGAVDPLMASYWKDAQGEMHEYPVNFLDELAAQSPYFRENFTSYKMFSETTMGQIINTDSIPNEQKYFVNNISSQILINEGGSFSWKKLPVETQVSPINEFLIQDFNGDNLPDILMAGNDYSYDVSTGYFDANRGILMLNEGDGNFKILSSSESGIVLKGQVESLLYIDGPKPKVIAGINRDSVKVYEVNTNHP